MMWSPAEIFFRSGEWGDLARTLVLSAALHVGVFVLWMEASTSVRRTPPIVSYGVDLVAPMQWGPRVARAPAVGPPHPPSRSMPAQPAPEPPSVKGSAKRERVPARVRKVKKKVKPAAHHVRKRVSRKVARKNKKRAPVKPRSKRTKRDLAAGEQRKRDAAIAAAVHRRSQQVSSLPAAGGVSETAGSLSAGTGVVRGVEYLLYYNSMIRRVKENWAWAGRRSALEAVVRFRVAADGSIVDVRTLRSSGDAGYDASVERAVRLAGPLGAPPARYREEFMEGVEITFRVEDLRG